MSEFMGLIRGAYDGKRGGFLPGGDHHSCLLCAAVVCRPSQHTGIFTAYASSSAGIRLHAALAMTHQQALSKTSNHL